MPQKENNKKGQNKTSFTLIPLTTTLLLKKTPTSQIEHNPLDFHLEIIKKVDKILSDHAQEPDLVASIHQPPTTPPQPPTPIEPRPPLNKSLAREEISWGPSLGSPQPIVQTVPEEFKTELTIAPEFRFITSHEFQEIITQTPPSQENRVEIIDLPSLAGEISTSQKTVTLPSIKNQNDGTSVSILIQKEDLHRHLHNTKIEVIDARNEKQKLYEDACITAGNQADQIEKKAQVYFLNSKVETEKKQKKLQIEQTYIPDDFEERCKALKEKQKKEEELRRQEEEKRQKQLQAEQQIIHKQKKPKSKQIDLEKQTAVASKATFKKSQRDIKKELKEKKRLQRLALRKAHADEKRHLREQKKALKLKLKQQHLEEKQKGKHHQKRTDAHRQAKHAVSQELDEEVKKVLRMTDSLLEKLPDEVIDQFVQSENFDIYQRVMNKYKVYERVMNKQRIK